MLADRVRISYMSGGKMYDDPLQSVGSWDLILGDREKGYFGTVNGLVNNTQLTNLMTMTSGTLLDGANTDITFHKFIHKGRILLIPSRPIKHTISWDNIQAQNGVKGKVISINGQEYLCRLMTGSRHYYTGNASIAGGEWEDLFVGFHVSMGGVLTNIDLGLGISNGYINWNAEVSSTGINYKVIRPNGSVVTTIGHSQPNSIDSIFGWRPVLEVL